MLCVNPYFIWAGISLMPKYKRRSQILKVNLHRLCICKANPLRTQNFPNNFLPPRSIGHQHNQQTPEI
ncbi:hypothetical protein L2E82_27557 [Cichorium intybus]|uniref:Uncharacterized protein n=1 Tax=Cichorium intybus TaxID=13427 RepID=A0ACB9CTF6_CICIN|nr:hypothetical protein L2E82_27557 [Cichorium intybus]